MIHDACARFEQAFSSLGFPKLRRQRMDGGHGEWKRNSVDIYIGLRTYWTLFCSSLPQLPRPIFMAESFPRYVYCDREGR